MIFLLLFYFLSEDIREYTAKEESCRIRDYAEESYLRRCAEAGMFDSAEHIAVVPGYYKAHDVGEN